MFVTIVMVSDCFRLLNPSVIIILLVLAYLFIILGFLYTYQTNVFLHGGTAANDKCNHSIVQVIMRINSAK